MIVSQNPVNYDFVLGFVLTIVCHIIHAVIFIVTMKHALRNPGLSESVPIDLGDARKCMESFRKVRDRVIAGHRFCVFPEGSYVDNGNTMREFHTGCLHFVKDMNCPLVPVCICRKMEELV